MFTKEEFMNGLKEIIGERNDDTALGVLEYLKNMEEPKDFSEEIKTLTEKVTTLETEKSELENTWRNKYKEAFFSTPKQEQTDEQQRQYGKEPDQTKLDYENLFTEIQ